MSFYKQYGKRIINHEYYDITELDIGTIPYDSINRALRHEIFLRKTPQGKSWQEDFHRGIYSSVLVRFPQYIESLYDFCIFGHSYRLFFSGYRCEILESFEYLFPSVVKRLDKLQKNSAKSSKSVFQETNLAKI